MVSPAVVADGNDHTRTSVVFGRGLNTAQPGNPVNHAIFPKSIKVKAGSVVDFSIAGFHDIVIFNPGFRLADLELAGGGVFPTFPPVYVMQPDPALPLPMELADKVY